LKAKLPSFFGLILKLVTKGLGSMNIFLYLSFIDKYFNPKTQKEAQPDRMMGKKVENV